LGFIHLLNLHEFRGFSSDQELCILHKKRDPMKYLKPLAFLLFITSCQVFKKTSDSELSLDRSEQLVNWLSGSWSNGEQAAEVSVVYHLDMHVYQIWLDRKDGYWLYVEQASESNPSAPYRQQVYQVLKNNDKYEIRVNDLPAPEKVIRGWIGGTPLDTWTPEDLKPRKGCTVFIEYDTEINAFRGSSGKATCANLTQGAAYSEREIVVSSDRLVDFDRGFDQQGKQVWGASKVPYIYKEITDLPD